MSVVVVSVRSVKLGRTLRHSILRQDHPESLEKEIDGASNDPHQKSVRPERMRENIDVFDFEITEGQMTRVATLDRGKSLFFDHRDPAMVSQLGNRRLD
jgi:hypothetical protein